MYRIGFQASAAIFAKFFLHSPPTLFCLVSLDSLSWRTSKKLMRRRLRTLTKHSEELDRVSLSGNGTKITIYDLIFAKVVIIQPGIQTLHSFAFKQASNQLVCLSPPPSLGPSGLLVHATLLHLTPLPIILSPE